MQSSDRSFRAFRMINLAGMAVDEADWERNQEQASQEQERVKDPEGFPDDGWTVFEASD